MAEPHPARDSENRGLFSDISALLGTAAEYLRARLRLVGIEAKEALVHLLWIAIILVVAFGAVVLGYIFLLLGLVFTIERLTGIQWMWLLLAVGIGHLVVTVVCALVVRARISNPLFTWTLTEFKKDQEWLSKPTTKNSS